LNNQMQLGVALKAFESQKNAFPGWRNTVMTTSGTSTVSWVTMLLPNMERGDLWQKVTTGSPVATYGANTLRALVCPSDPTTVSGDSSYIANGLVLRDQYLYKSNASTYVALAPQTSDYVSANDGTTNTLMLGENTQSPPSSAPSATPKAHLWSDQDTATPTSTYQIKQTFGFGPLPTPPAPNPPYPPALLTFANVYNGQVSAYNGNPMTANINSNHGSGANVVFFDGHGQFLKDDVGLNMVSGSSVTVYQVLVTPEGSKNGSEPVANESDW
jgi:prepilin-type processing-associated H-X9-DG protein